MLLLAKKKEFDDEESLTKVKVRECQKMDKDISDVGKRLLDLKEKENACEVNVFV